MDMTARAVQEGLFALPYSSKTVLSQHRVLELCIFLDYEHLWYTDAFKIVENEYCGVGPVSSNIPEEAPLDSSVSTEAASSSQAPLPFGRTTMVVRNPVDHEGLENRAKELNERIRDGQHNMGVAEIRKYGEDLQQIVAEILVIKDTQ